MSCCDRAGLNQISSLDVPNQSGQFGGLLDVSSFAATKGAPLTVELTGTYDGSFSIYGSHDGAVFAPIFSFSSGAGKQNLRQVINFPLKYLVAKKLGSSSSPITISVSGRAACNCAGTGSAGANQFLALGTFGANAQTGPLASVDLWSLVANTGLDPGMSVTCGGSFDGLIGVEGSLDGSHFLPLGTDLAGRPTAGFQVAPAPRTPGVSPVAAELAPLLIPDIVRYLRPNLRLGNIYTPVSLAVGGRQNCDCPITDPCAAGQTIVDVTAAAQVNVNTDGAVGPTFGVYEIPLGPFANCPNFQLTISADCQLLGGSATIRAYLNDSGLDLATRAFIGAGGNAPAFANIPVIIDGVFHTYDWKDYPAGAGTFVDFAGPLPAQSIYLYPTSVFPAFLTGNWNVKNVHVKVVTV